ncbi:MAG TPA: adenylate/guanylate cyclase domain-containing protein [Verrucomicrobiae bacterium]|nr:adenylate/guanylate cyclase domain-containing protein [Verrucomicrobiae bacterium]
MAGRTEARPDQGGLRVALLRLIAIADEPGDDDDRRLRKRVGVLGGYLTIVAPLGLPLAAPTPLVGWVVALVLSLWSAGNLAVLARTKNFDRYVIALVSAGPPFVLLTTVLSGGVTHTAGLVWAFLTPAYALLALGPQRAIRWFLVFLATLIIAVAIDPFVGGLVPPPPYATQLVFYVQNIGAPLAITFLLLRYTDLRRRAAEQRSDELLTNAIPASIATRLRHGEQRIAESYPDTTVVFADIVGFTPWAQRTDPALVVSLLDDLFSRFDTAAAEHGIEKIKTVGDAYMAAAGAPQPRDDHAQAALGFARAILSEVAGWRQANGIDLEARVGLASGRVVGGVIGTRRILFDLWGDTVNTAARMESSGVPGRIHLAASTRSLLTGPEAFEERQIEIKGLGSMTTFLVPEVP